MYPPTVPPMRVVMTMKLTWSGRTAFFRTAPRGGRDVIAIHAVSPIIKKPRTTTILSMTAPARL